MRKSFLNIKNLSFFLLTTLSLSVLSCSDDDKVSGPIVEQPGTAPNANFTALTIDNKVVYYNAQNLSSPISTLTITGLQASETILSIDYRPATGQLYALGSTSRLYIINEQSGLATALGSASFDPMITSQNASIDFNPTVDRIRLVTDSGQNLRLHPELGTVLATDGTINGGSNPKFGAVAYTNSMAGATTTMLYDIDFATDKLYVQTPPNDGGLQEVGDLTVDFMGMGGFDIMADNSVALAVVKNDTDSRLYTINLDSGKALWVGTFGMMVKSLAIKTNPVAFATSADNKLYRFNPMSPTMNPVDLMGLMNGETIVGLDFRPANGALYAISNQSRLLTVNTANGQVTPIGSGLIISLSGIYFGFDFNPTVDRIRLVSNTGQNLRLHPDLGTVVFTDGSLNPGSPNVNAAAYDNNFAMSTATTLYVLDSQTNMMYKQIPPNDGTLVPVGALGINFDAENGFDIGGNSNRAFGLLKVNNTTAVYSFNLTTGAATKTADFNINATAMALGLGF
ncbi:DUF4394 domain-containing protein [Flavobacterium sp.]|jgi:hypothetical protein|uniref:DUF4394 domain-containing protein n=1 Tax=Flavobacterium sp. TaxID=239 RepID=UPI0037BFB086